MSEKVRRRRRRKQKSKKRAIEREREREREREKAEEKSLSEKTKVSKFYSLKVREKESEGDWKRERSVKERVEWKFCKEMMNGFYIGIELTSAKAENSKVDIQKVYALFCSLIHVLLSLSFSFYFL